GGGRGARLELTTREIRRPDRKLEVVSELCGRRPIAAAVLAVTLPALGRSVDVAPAFDQGGGGRRGGRRQSARLRLLVAPARGKRLDEGDDRSAGLHGQPLPRGHGRPPPATRAGPQTRGRRGAGCRAGR